MSHVKPGEETHMPAYPLGEPPAEQEKLEHQRPEGSQDDGVDIDDIGEGGEREEEDTEGASAEQRPPADS